jgi:uncharacterized secreted protein with C-terminal beta-propeller domain
MNESAPNPVQSNGEHHIKTPLIFTGISAVVFLLLGIFGVLFLTNQQSLFDTPADGTIKKFASEKDMRDYLTESANVSGFSLGGITTGIARNFAVEESLDSFAPAAQAVTGEGGDASRVSSTNVQVAGIDEPDIVKTDGESIFFSSENYFYPTIGRPIPVEPFGEPEASILVAPDFAPAAPSTKVISAIPPESIGLTAEIEENGQLLISGGNLMVIARNKITAFNVASPQNPTEMWSYNFDENFSYSTARLMDGKVYLVTTRYADYSLPCPVPVLRGTSDLTIACTDIYYPLARTSINNMYSIVRIDPTSGVVEDSISFLGEAGSSVLYMSPNAIYATFTSYPDPLDFIANFFTENNDLLGNEVITRVNNLRALDISNESKINELQIILQRYLSSLSNDERARIENEMTNRMNKYLSVHGRELQITSIIKIDKNSLDTVAAGKVPGSPLNQFSLDEYNGDLRIATTLSASTMFGRGESENDLYVLGSDLSTKGQIQGLALGERIYSARFIEDTAYLVTFRQIDPFFVVDLSNPTSPRVAGELKIPGFSSYLHPLTDTKILGVGQENNQSKLSIFDVGNPDNPIESDKYTLDEYYSEVQNNHHAFLLDPKNQVFFMPAGSSGYIFSYNGELSLERVISDISAKRAIYIDNYLYVIGEQKMVVLDESDWSQVSTLDFQP